MDLEKMFQEDAELTSMPTTQELTDIEALCAKQLHLERELKACEDYAKRVKEALQNVQEVAIPNLMATIGLKEFKLSNGMKVSIKEDVYASMRKDFIPQAVAWLDDHNLGGIVKDEVKVNFGRGETQNAKELLDFCQTHGFIADEKLSVHPMTLKATVKEQMSQGVEFPEEFFSIAPINKSVIKLK